MFSVLTAKLLFLMFPGLLSLTLIQAFIKSNERKYTPQFFFLYSFIVSMCIYAFTNIFFKNSLLSSMANFNQNLNINLKEISTATLFSILATLLFCKLNVLRKYQKSVQSLEVTSFSGYDSILEKFLPFGDEEYLLAEIHFVQQDLTYVGYITSVTHSVNYYELYLETVKFYEKKKKCIEFDATFLRITSTDNVHIKFSKVQNEEVKTNE